MLRKFGTGECIGRRHFHRQFNSRHGERGMHHDRREPRWTSFRYTSGILGQIYPLQTSTFRADSSFELQKRNRKQDDTNQATSTQHGCVTTGLWRFSSCGFKENNYSGELACFTHRRKNNAHAYKTAYFPGFDDREKSCGSVKRHVSTPSDGHIDTG